MQPGDLVIAVCDNAHEELPAGTDAAFDLALDQIRQRIDRIAVTPATHPAS